MPEILRPLRLFIFYRVGTEEAEAVGPTGRKGGTDGRKGCCLGPKLILRKALVVLEISFVASVRVSIPNL